MVGLDARLQPWWADRAGRTFTLIRLGGLGAVVWAVAGQQSARLPGQSWALPVLLAGASLGWVAWMAGRRLDPDGRFTWAALGLLSLSGGLLTGYSPVATAFLAVACLGAGIAFGLEQALPIALIGLAAVAGATLGLGAQNPGEVVAEGALAATAGLMAGFSRRQYLGRARQAEQLLAEQVRADTERDRAAALAERNRLGRELHDVLAHSLGALAVQLEAADALFAQGRDDEKARALLRDARHLAVQGLEETRQAVLALRDEPVPLARQLAGLATRNGADLVVHGPGRMLRPEAGLALYRAAQEALTNARKHAPGAPVRVSLTFTDGTTELVVANGACPLGAGDSQIERTGGGFGLRGMSERLELVGGHLEARSDGPGWIVLAAVPE